MGLYNKIGRILPDGYINKVDELTYLTDTDPKRLSGFGFIFSLFLTGLVASIVYFPFDFPLFYTPAGGIGGFIVGQLVLFGALYLSLQKKKKFMATVLPDALLLMAANIRSGMTPGRALILSAKDEFGPLKREIEKTGRQIMAGKGLQEAFEDFKNRVRSDTLERVISLVISSIRTGGKLAITLEETADNVRSLEIAQKRIKSNVVMYVIFIVIAAGFGAPLLFSLSLFLIKAVTRFGGVEMPEAVSQASMFELGTPTVSPDFIFRFSLITLGVISTSGGFILGAIRSGKAKKGIKFIPLLLLLSYGVFFLSYKAVTTLFSGFFF